MGRPYPSRLKGRNTRKGGGEMREKGEKVDVLKKTFIFFFFFSLPLPLNTTG